MKSLQIKLTVTILVIFLCSLSVLGGLNYWKARDIVKENITAELRTSAENIATNVNDWLSARQNEMVVLSSAPVVVSGNKEAMLPSLIAASKAQPVYDTIGYATLDGQFINSARAVGSIADRPYFKKVVKDGQSTVSDPVMSKSTGNMITVVAIPVKEGNQVKGVLYGAISMEGISKQILAVKVGKTGYAYVLQADGLTIANPNKELVLKDNPLKNEKLSPTQKQTAELMVKGETGVATYEYLGVEKIVGYAPVKSAGWSLAVTLPVKEATEVLSTLTWISLLTTVIVLLIAAVIIAWFAKSITKPIQTLEVAANKIAGGDLSQTTLGINTDDEVGRLAKSFEQMARNVRTLIQHISGEAEHLAASSQELTASAEQSSQATNQVAISIQEVASGAAEQMNAANNTVTVVTEMSAGIQQIAANASSVSVQTEIAAEKAVKGGAAVGKAVSQMGQIEQTVNTSAQVVAKLGERSKEIGQIVDAISGIAGQTNLLALNAAIEAARAGEQGRGFAVVAEEVRKLAEQSEGAAKKIAGLIGEIQIDTDKAVKAMEQGTQEVKTGAEVVDAAGVSFHEIATLVMEVSTQVKQISTAIQEMASGSQKIVESVNIIDKLSKNSAGEAQSVSAATEEQLASMEEIATSSRALATLAQELQTAVGKFRI